MTKTASKSRTRKELVDALMERHGRTFSAELGLDLARNRPTELFRWLCAALLLSARISSKVAVHSAAALADQGLTTARKMADAGWERRVKILNRAGYARYDEKTSRMLGEAASKLIEEYGGDLRKLRERAEEDPQTERKLLKEFKGIGDVGVDIFFREAQAAWPELYPFADQKALKAAGKLGLPGEAQALARLTDRERYPALLAALVRTDLEKDFEAVEQAAAG